MNTQPRSRFVDLINLKPHQVELLRTYPQVVECPCCGGPPGVHISENPTPQTINFFGRKLEVVAQEIRACDVCDGGWVPGFCAS